MTRDRIIQENVKSMIEEKVNSKPFDFLFRKTSESYPKSNHIALELPGTFKKIEPPTVFTLNGRSLQQDLVESVFPDNKTLHHEATYNLEHMSYPINPEKTEVFYLCKNSTIKKHDKPCIIYMITNIDYKTDEMICKINSEAFSIKIIYISQERIDKILNTISKIDYSKEEISEVDFVRLIHCLIFAQKEQAQRVVKKVVEIFIGIKKIKFQHHIDLHQALKTMIKYHFKKMSEQEELLKMITEAMTDEELEELSTFEYRYNKVKEELQVKDQFIEERDQLLEENKKTIEKNEKTIVEKEKTIEEKDKEIEKLKALLRGK